MRMTVDGVCFQTAPPSDKRMWKAVLSALAGFADLEIILLDRGHSPDIKNIDRVAFSSYAGTYTAAESFLIDRVCARHRAEVFLSTGNTTPIRIPSVLLLNEVGAGFWARSDRAAQEQKTAIAHASYLICATEALRSELTRVSPSVRERAIVARKGIARTMQPRSAADIATFKARFGLTAKYYICAGSAEVDSKGTEALFGAAARLGEDITILYLDGEAQPKQIASPPNVAIRHLDLAEDDLACAYSGATALLCAAFYRGSELPILEALACGCPVVAPKDAALVEILGAGGIFVAGQSRKDIETAVIRASAEPASQASIDRGLARANKADWETFAGTLYSLLKRASDERGTPENVAFFEKWRRLRALQNDVDVGL